MRRIFLLTLLSLLPGISSATTFSTPIPGFVGVIDFGSSTIGPTASFDFGQQFAEIDRVFVEIDAHVVAQQFDSCPTPASPTPPCFRQVNLLGFSLLMDEEDKPFLGSIRASLNVSDDLNAIEATGTGIGEFTDPFDLNPFGWDILLDGEGSLTLSWNSLFPPQDRIIQNFQDVSGEILGARLIVEGTPVPEPSTAVLLMTALAVLAGTRKGLWRIEVPG